MDVIEAHKKNEVIVDICSKTLLIFGSRVEKIVKDLKRMSFQPSCLDFEWGWRVELVYDRKGSPSHFLIYSGFLRPDTHTGEVSRGWGRPWTISFQYGDKELYMTCWMAIEQIIKHEAMEAYSIDNCRLFDPHKTMDQLKYPEV